MLSTEWLGQQEELGGTEVSEAGRQRRARAKLRNQSEIDEGQLELRGFACINKVAVRKQGSTASNCSALHGGDHRLIQVHQSVTETSLRTLASPRWVLQKILDIIACTKRISRGIPNYDIYFVVLCCLIQGIRKCVVHGSRHCILLGGPVHRDSQNASRLFT